MTGAASNRLHPQWFLRSRPHGNVSPPSVKKETPFTFLNTPEAIVLKNNKNTNGYENRGRFKILNRPLLTRWMLTGQGLPKYPATGGNGLKADTGDRGPAISTRSVSDKIAVNLKSPPLDKNPAAIGADGILAAFTRYIAGVNKFQTGFQPDISSLH